MAIHKKISNKIHKDRPEPPQSHTMDWTILKEKAAEKAKKDPQKSAKILSDWINRKNKKSAA